MYHFCDRRPDEGDLLRLADAQQRSNNTVAQIGTLEKLVANYPKKDYWAAVLGRLPRKPGFSDRYALDVLRLRLATDNLRNTEEVMEMAQLALQAGYAAEARRVVDKGYALGALGVGPEAERHKRLQNLALKQDAEMRANLERSVAEAKDGNALVQVGSVLANAGQVERGVALIEQGIAQGNLKRPEDAQLRLGQALLQSSKTKYRAPAVLHSVKAADGAADIAQLFAVLAAQP